MTKKDATHPSKTPDLQRMIEAEPDLIDRIFEFLVAHYPQVAGMPEEHQRRIKTDLRAEFHGETCYIAERPATARQERVCEILSLFNGRNATEVARCLQISRATVYRVIKQQGKPKNSRTFSGFETTKTLEQQTPIAAQTTTEHHGTHTSRS